MVLGGTYEDLWGGGTKTTPQAPRCAITAKNKTYKCMTLLHYDFFSSCGLLPVLHKFGKGSLSSQCANRKGHKKPELSLAKKPVHLLVLKLVLRAKSVLLAT